MESPKSKFSWKVLISFGLLYSFIIIFITGIVLYLAPAGRIANWVNWKILGLSKEDWQAIHTIFSFAFVVLSIFHLFSINWKVFWSYLSKKSVQGLNKKRELFISTALAILFFVGTIFAIPPFSSVVNFGSYLKGTWEDKTKAPPLPHAELLTLVELSEKLDSTSLEKITNRLTANHIKFDTISQTLNEIALKNKITPLAIYEIITKKALSGMVGSGMGRKTLEEIAVANNKDVNELIKILASKNIKATKEQTLKDIASENDMAAKDIYELIK